MVQLAGRVCRSTTCHDLKKVCTLSQLLPCRPQALCRSIADPRQTGRHATNLLIGVEDTSLITVASSLTKSFA